MQQSKEWNVRKSNDLFLLRNWDSIEHGAPYLLLSLSFHWGNGLSASTCGQASGAERIGNSFSFLIPLSFSLSQVSLSPSLQSRNVLPLLELQLVARPLVGVAGFLWGVCALVEDTRAHEDYFIKKTNNNNKKPHPPSLLPKASSNKAPSSQLWRETGIREGKKKKIQPVTQCF